MRAAGFMAIVLSLSIILSSCVFMRRGAPEPVVAPAVCAPQPLVGTGKLGSRGEALTLEQCIEIARANNPSLASGGWDVQVALAQRDNVASERWPNFRGVSRYNSFVQNQRLVQVRKNNDPGMFSTSILAADIVLRLPLFTGGRIRSEISAAELLSLAATQRLARTWEELIYNVSSAFYTILGQRPVIKSLQFSIEALNGQRKRALDMMRVGKAAKVEVLRTEVRISDVEQRLVREQTVLEIQRRALVSLMGIDVGNEPVQIQGNLNVNRSVPDLNGALAMAYAERSDHKSARASVDSTAMRLAAARGARWPSVSLEGSYGTRVAAGITDNAASFINRFIRTPPPLGQGKDFDSPGVSTSLPVGNIGVVAEYPIFDGGRITAQISEQEARLASVQANLRKLWLQIRLDVETALLNVDSARTRVRATRKAIEQSNESFRIESEKYDLGKGSITDVLDAQAAMLDAETNHYRALSDYNIALAQLGLATGEKR